MVKLGFIGGSGAKEVVEALSGSARAKTSRVYGMRNQLLGEVDYFHFVHGETEVYFTLRHRADHSVLPAELDQRIILKFLKEKGVNALVLASATGSLNTKVKLVDEGGFVVPSGIFRGFGYQGRSFGGVGAKDHAAVANPFAGNIRNLLLASVSGVENTTAFGGGLYVQNEGNQFESPAEVADLYMRLDAPERELRRINAQRHLLREVYAGNPPESMFEEIEAEEIFYNRLAESLSVNHAQLGMTAVGEVTLAVEMGINHGLVCFPVNYGEGLLPEPISHERTEAAISSAKEPFIVPFFKKVIELAPEYIGK